VIGAGPSGSSTAALLARSGLSVLAADRASFPRDKACSEYMSPETVRILSRLGVLDALEKAGAIGLEGLKVTAGGGTPAQGRFAQASPAPYRRTGLSISRRILDHELVAAARRSGAMVVERTFVEDLLHHENGAIAGAVLRDREGVRHSVSAKLTVGADGLRSVVARKIGRRRHGRPRRVAFVAHMAGVAGMGLSAELHFSSAGYVGLNPVAQGLTNVALVLPAEHALSARGRVQQFFLERIADFSNVRERLQDATMVRQVMATGPFAAWSRRVVAPGALLVGDAADFFDPFTGDGIYAALRGAELVAEIMTYALGQPDPLLWEALQGYRLRRRREFAGKWMFERFIGWSMSFPRLFERGINRIARREGMATALVGVAGGFVPSWQVLNPVFLTRMVF
jgi:flavin-dependent dehydrogenase